MQSMHFAKAHIRECSPKINFPVARNKKRHCGAIHVHFRYQWLCFANILSFFVFVHLCYLLLYHRRFYFQKLG